MIFDTEKLDRLRQDIKHALELDNADIPEDIKISTMTLEAKLNTRFYPYNIYKYIRRSEDGITSVVNESKKKEKNKSTKSSKKDSKKNAKQNEMQNPEDSKDDAKQ